MRDAIQRGWGGHRNRDTMTSLNKEGCRTAFFSR